MQSIHLIHVINLCSTWLIVELAIYTFLNSLSYDLSEALNQLLALNTITAFLLFILIYGLFGSYETFSKIHHFYTLQVEKYVYRNSTLINKEIEKLKAEYQNNEQKLKELMELEESFCKLFETK